MSSCLYCGSTEQNSDRKFCTDCGNNWPANQVVDKPADVHRYVDSLYQSVQSSNFDDSTEKLIKKMRERFKISHATHQRIIEDLRERLQIVEGMHNFTLEFNQNDSDAYAEQDTLLQFRLVNDTSAEQLKSVELTWDDPDSASGRAFRAATSMPVRPGGTASLQGSHVFMRFGPKSIDRMQLRVELPWGDVGEFIIEPMVFNVRNPDQKISKNITNNISMERGVLDNSTNLADADGAPLTVGRQAIWKKLSLFPTVQKPDQIEDLIVAQSMSQAEAAPVVAAVVQPVAVAPAEPKEQPQTAAPEPEPSTAPVAESAEPAPAHEAPASKEQVGASRSLSSQDPSQCNEERTCANQVLKSLAWFASASTISKPNTVITSDRFDLDFLDLVFHNVPDPVEDAVLGMVFQDGDTVVFDQHNCVINFSGNAFVVSDFGIAQVSISDNTLNADVSHSWGEAASLGWGFYSRRFGDDKYVVSFGDGSLSQTLPGCKFDLRQYQGDVPVSQALADAEAWLNRLYELVPAFEDDEDDEEEESEDLDHAEAIEEAHEDLANDESNHEEQNIASDEASTWDENEEDEDAVEEERQQTLDEIGSRMQRFFGKLAFALQRCDENQPLCVFPRDRVHDDLLESIYDAAYNTGTGMRVVCVEPGCALIDESGLLVGWKGMASALSAEGIFHMVAQPSGGYMLDGANSFLGWQRFFDELGGNLIVREDGPDLWLGTPMNYLIRGCYVDYSVQVLQWDYFENYVNNELQNYLNLFRESVDWL